MGMRNWRCCRWTGAGIMCTVLNTATGRLCSRWELDNRGRRDGHVFAFLAEVSGRRLDHFKLLFAGVADDDDRLAPIFSVKNKARGP